MPCQNLNRVAKDFVIRLVLYILYSLLGALVFVSIENIPIEKELENLEKTRAEARYSLTDMQNSTNFLNMTVDQMVAFAKRVVEVENKLTATPKEWTFKQGYHLTFEIMTTIGKKKMIYLYICIFFSFLFLMFLEAIFHYVLRVYILDVLVLRIWNSVV